MTETVLPRLYPVTIRLACARCDYVRNLTVWTFKAQKQWTDFYVDQHWQTCDGTLETTVPLDFQPQGLGNDEGTQHMGGNAHSTEVKVETEDATTTVSTPDEASTETTSDESTSEDDSKE